jgi:hypothetical protein
MFNTTEANMELRIDETRNIAYIKLSGRLGRQEILDAFDATVSHERYRPGMGRLWDFREADLSSLDVDTIAEMAKHSTKFPAGINDVKVAFVAGRNLEFGLSRMFEVFSESAGAKTKIAVFDAMQDAEIWMAD